MVPVQYAVHLIPNLADNTFLGSQTVEIDVLSTTSKIMLNVVNMAIDAASLSGRDIGEIRLTPQTFWPPRSASCPIPPASSCRATPEGSSTG